MAVISDYLDRPYPTTPTDEIGIGGFTALARVRESYRLTAEVPETPVEDGSFVNDHIIIRPLTVTIEGSVADVFIRRAALATTTTRVLAEIGNVASQFAPPRTQSQIAKAAALANDVTDALRRLDSVLDAGTQAFNFIGNRDTTTKGLRESFIDMIEGYHKAKTVLSIDMPYRRLDNMVITSFVSSTDNVEDTTTFTIEAQQLQYASTIYAEVATPAAGLSGQTTAGSDKGVQEGEDVTESLATQLKDAIFGQ